MIARESPDWLGTRSWLDARIAEATEKLISPDCMIKEGDQLRGKIAAWRELIQAVEAKPEMPVSAARDPRGNY